MEEKEIAHWEKGSEKRMLKDRGGPLPIFSHVLSIIFCNCFRPGVLPALRNSCSTCFAVPLLIVLKKKSVCGTCTGYVGQRS